MSQDKALGIEFDVDGDNTATDAFDLMPSVVKGS